METPNSDPLVLDENHAEECHSRWIQRMKHDIVLADSKDTDICTEQQCGMCRFYIPLRGALSADWGVCSNSLSPYDGTVMFEHDGCAEYSGASEWVATFLSFQSKKHKP